MECCEKCFDESSLIDFIQKNGHKKESDCQFCEGIDGKAIYLSKLKEKFLNIVAEEYVLYDELTQYRHVDGSDGEYLSNLIQEDFEVFSEKVKNEENLFRGHSERYFNS